MVRVLVGGSFACDDALAQPLAALLRELDERESVDVEWLAYGGGADLVALDGPLRRARADLVVLLVRLSDLGAAHPELQDRRATQDAVPHESAFHTQLQAYDSRLDVPPLVVLFCPSPPSSPATDTSFRSYEAQEAAMTRAIQAMKLVSCCASRDALAFFDGDEIADWYDATGDKREHAPFTPGMLRVLALGCARQISRLRLHSAKKVIVLDCDNTLWGGAVADVGPTRVELSARFLALQQFVVDQQSRGVLLCLCSKNIPEDVDAAFRERASEMVLHLDQHVVTSRVNWRAKSENIREIAQQLKLGLDAFVFVDDNALECHEVATALPMVSVVHVPEDFEPNFLATQWAFDTPLDFRATEEDSERTKLYQQNAQRDEHERRATSHAAFLSSLGIRIQRERLTDTTSASFDRVLQLHQRTNTFNVATTFSRALTSDALATYATATKQTSHFALASTVTDRYGHYGLVCAALFRLIENPRVVEVDSFLMSCRSLNRGVEHAMVKKIAEIARTAGVDAIRVAWEPTVRNEPVRIFFASLSFSTFEPLAGGEVTNRTEKIARSAGEGGWWRLHTEDAIKISFMKEQQERADESAFAQHQQMTLVASWRQQAQTAMVRFVKIFIRLATKWNPRVWLGRFFMWVYQRIMRRRVGNRSSQDTSIVSFHSRAQLDAFMAANLGKLANSNRQLPLGDSADRALDDETDEAFRLRVRHQTKLLLLDHVADDAPRVVWAPHRSDDVRLDEGEDDDSETTTLNASRAAAAAASLQHFHRPCASPGCAAQVYWESECAFQRCRTCCYRVQRLLARATSDRVHAKARAHACSSLADDFNVSTAEIQVRDEWCAAHTNERRRK